MTRESKLALIVGFGLILFVGILVSDHFSAGQRQESAHLLAQRGAWRGRSGPITLEPLVPGLTATQVQSALHVGEGDGARGSAPDQASEPGRATPQAGSSGGGLEEIVIGAGPTRPEIPPPPQRDSQNAPDSSAAPRDAADQPLVRLHPVKRGETLYSICVAQYGDGSLHQALAEFNKSAVPNPSRMRAGVTLRLPPIEVLRPAAPSSAPLAGTSRGAGDAVAPPPVRTERGELAAADNRSATTPARASTYTVQRGETLSDIAARTMGSSRHWPRLAQANQDVIRDPNAIVPGTVLRIPS